ncbi:MAG: T9SS type A sorting domain-containing protein [Bacteroidales bacterium]|nr:T9SS type A sorting domain-containing protein [Bacteroidales bacterium]
MKRTILIIFVLISCDLSAQQAVTPQVNNDGKFFFQVGNTYFQINPNHGARIDSYKLGNSEFLYLGNQAADMYGSTCWLSPQDIWNWPPQTQIDKDAFTGGISGNKVILTSAVASAGSSIKFQVRKTISANLADSSISIDYTLINKSTTKQSFAAWEVTRVPTGGLTLFPINGVVTGKIAPAFTIIDDIAWWDYDSTKAIFEKGYADGRDGWMAHINNNRIIHIKKFDDAASNFPNGSNGEPREKEVEFWGTSDRTYNELEKQNEYSAIEVNDSTTLSMKWYLRMLPEGISISAGNQEIIDYINSIVNPSIAINTKRVKHKSFDVFPNPTAGRLKIEGPSSESRFQLCVYNISGKKVYEVAVSNGETLDLSVLDDGIYLCQIRSRDEVYMGKVIIRK